MPSAAVYCRVSTGEQAESGYSLITQVYACVQHAQTLGYEVPEHLIFREDYTGASLNRPQLTKLRDLVSQRAISAVIVYDHDRLSRKLAHLLLLQEEFDHAGIRLHVVTMPHGDTSPESQLLASVKGVVAEYERTKLLERTARGHRGRAQAGYISGGRRTYGYRRVPHGKGAHYVIDTVEGPVVQRIFTLYLQGLSTERIAERLTREGVATPTQTQRGFPAGVWHPATISYILRNETYTGAMYHGKKERQPGKANPDKKTRWRKRPREAWIPIPVPALIDRETYDAVQARLRQQRQHSKRNRKHEYLLINGRLRCGQCGRAMGGALNSKDKPGYRCYRPVFQDVVVSHLRRSVQASAVEPVVWAEVERILQDPTLIMSAVEDQQTDTSSKQERLAHERASYQRQLSRCEHDLQRWEAAYLAEVITLEDFRSKKADVETRRASAEQELARLDTEEHMLTQTAETTIAIVAYCQHVGERVAGMSLEEKRLALEALGIVATWHPEKPLDIRGNIPLVIETNASK